MKRSPKFRSLLYIVLMTSIGCSENVRLHVDLRDAKTKQPVLATRYEFADRSVFSTPSPDAVSQVGNGDSLIIRAKAPGYDLFRWQVVPRQRYESNWETGSFERTYPIYPDKQLEMKLTIHPVSEDKSR